tara:strand:- start:135 stop:566 length:432 start_codon:yes stop_codon:yes gene_type:complete
MLHFGKLHDSSQTPSPIDVGLHHGVVESLFAKSFRPLSWMHSISSELKHVKKPRKSLSAWRKPIVLISVPVGGDDRKLRKLQVASLASLVESVIAMHSAEALVWALKQSLIVCGNVRTTKGKKSSAMVWHAYVVSVQLPQASA